MAVKRVCVRVRALSPLMFWSCAKLLLTKICSVLCNQWFCGCDVFCEVRGMVLLVRVCCKLLLQLCCDIAHCSSTVNSDTCLFSLTKTHSVNTGLIERCSQVVSLQMSWVWWRVWFSWLCLCWGFIAQLSSCAATLLAIFTSVLATSTRYLILRFILLYCLSVDCYFWAYSRVAR